MLKIGVAIMSRQKSPSEHLEPLWNNPYYIVAEHISIFPSSSQHPAQERGYNCNKQYHLVVIIPFRAPGAAANDCDCRGPNSLQTVSRSVMGSWPRAVKFAIDIRAASVALIALVIS